MAWVRKVGGIRELIVASDSRLSGGQYWDANPKILLLPRSDAVISFAGATADAYPLMIQAYNAIKMFNPAETRVMDLSDLRGHLIRVFNHSRTFIHSLPHGQSTPDAPEAAFMLSGYSWKKKEFQIWTLHYDSHLSKFTFRPATKWRGQLNNGDKRIAFVGDEDVVKEAKRKLIEILRQRDKLSSSSLDMEPFEVLSEMLRSDCFPSIGGAPQLVKVYEHSNAIPVGVWWPQKEHGSLTLLGRPLMEFETIRWGAIDPDAPERAEPIKKEPTTLNKGGRKSKKAAA